MARGVQVVQAEAVAKNKGWRISILPCVVTPAGGHSGGVAIAVRHYIGMDESITAEPYEHL